MSGLQTLTIYGASDDCVELSGYVSAEFTTYGPLTLDIETPDGVRIEVTASFFTSWSIILNHVDPQWTYPVRLGAAPGDEDPAVHLDVPEGTTVLRKGGES